MPLIDEKFLRNKRRYFIQTALGFCSILVILILLDTVADAAVIASFGASSFIVFAMPNQEVSSPRRVVGGSLIGASVAFLIDLGGKLLGGTLGNLPIFGSVMFFGAAAVGVSMLLMVITNTEHPPAAGLALGFILEGFDFSVAAITLLGLVLLASVKRLIRKYLVDLI